MPQLAIARAEMGLHPQIAWRRLVAFRKELGLESALNPGEG